MVLVGRAVCTGGGKEYIRTNISAARSMNSLHCCDANAVGVDETNHQPCSCCWWPLSTRHHNPLCGSLLRRCVRTVVEREPAESGQSLEAVLQSLPTMPREDHLLYTQVGWKGGRGGGDRGWEGAAVQRPPPSCASSRFRSQLCHDSPQSKAHNTRLLPPLPPPPCCT